VAFPKRKEEVGGWFLVSITLQRWYIGVSLDAKVKEEERRGCVTLWPCHFTLKTILRSKRRIMKTQIIFHHAKI
jgi:hypothetical protein